LPSRRCGLAFKKESSIFRYKVQLPLAS
jgi:hypothetical protein